MDGTQVLTGADVSRAIQRMAHEVVEKNHGATGLVILGIPTRGVPLARRIAQAVEEIEPTWLADQGCGELDVTMYRDDLHTHPTRGLGKTAVPPSGIDAKTVLLVDDVLYSGRTIRAALDALVGAERPKAVRLAVLVDRGHRDLPIRADYVGKNLPTSLAQRVRLELSETDGRDAVLILGATA
jgi:pyrimidine operon attenuation protein/uracil phosphoribosyltransferase